MLSLRYCGFDLSLLLVVGGGILWPARLDCDPGRSQLVFHHGLVWH